MLGTSFLSCFEADLANLASSCSSDVAKFFQSSIKCVVDAVLNQMESAQISVSLYFSTARVRTDLFWFQHVILVGGFAASDWLYERVKAALTKKGLVVIRPANHVYVDKICANPYNLFFRKGTKPFPMVPYPFISTTMSAHVSLRSPTEARS